MYGTVARIQVKPGKVDELIALGRADAAPPGFVAEYAYRMDADPNTYYLVVLFESRESYFANADSPEQDARYRQMLEFLEGEPEWHDGTVVFATEQLSRPI